MKKALLYIHGKGGSHKEVSLYSDLCKEYDLIGVNYEVDMPWIVEKKIQKSYDEIHEGYDSISILANSIGAYFAMHSLQNREIDMAYFISPIVDMEQLIMDMMTWANISEKQLEKQKEIETNFDETLSWEYLCYVRKHPIMWNVETEILYATSDHLTKRETMDSFVRLHRTNVHVAKDQEHWFHTKEQMAIVYEWLSKVIK